MRIEGVNGNWAELYHADSVEMCHHCRIPAFDALIADPPYGIDYDPDAGEKKNRRFSVEDKLVGDTTVFDPSCWLELCAEKPCILWGGNNFASALPRGGWLVWDKRCGLKADKILGSPFELAWCSNPKLYDIARILHGGAVNADGAGIKRVHPTQKPVALMQFCLQVLRLQPGMTVLDPYMGSGSTGVAAMRSGLNFIGIELDHWYDNAVERITHESRLRKLI